MISWVPRPAGVYLRVLWEWAGECRGGGSGCCKAYVAVCFDGVFFVKQKTAYEIYYGLVGSEMCIRDRHNPGNQYAPDMHLHKEAGSLPCDPKTVK